MPVIYIHRNRCNSMDLLPQHINLVDSLDTLSTMLCSYRYRFTSEKELQDGIETALQQNHLAYLRETALSTPDRPDFLVEAGIAIEIKIKGTMAELLRQASRYAAHPDITGILVIGTPHWLPRVPIALCEKPVRAVRLMGSLL